MNKSFAVGENETQSDGFFLGELMFRGDERFAQILSELAMRREIEILSFADALVHKGLEQIVDIVATEMGVAVGGEHLVNVAFAGGDKFQDGDVEGATAKIVNGNVAALRFVQAVSERRGGGLIDEAQNFEAGDAAGVFGGLTLGIVEVRGNGDDGAIDGLTQIRLSPVSQFAQDERGNFRWRKHFVAEHDANDVIAVGVDAKREKLQFALHIGGAATHQALYGIDGAFGLGEQAAARGFADDDAGVGIEANGRRAEC